MFTALYYGEQSVALAGIRFHVGPGRHVIGTSVKDMKRAGPAVYRVLTYPAQIFPGQCLPEACGDFTLLLKLRFRHTGPAHHGQNQLFHIQNGRDKQCTLRRLGGQHGKICTDAVCTQRNGVPMHVSKGQSCLNVRDSCPGSQGFPTVPALPVIRQIDGQHLEALGANHLCKGGCFFLVAHLPVEKQVSLLRWFPV